MKVIIVALGLVAGTILIPGIIEVLFGEWWGKQARSAIIAFLCVAVANLWVGNG
jgi:hypothetical protein